MKKTILFAAFFAIFLATSAVAGEQRSAIEYVKEKHAKILRGGLSEAQKFLDFDDLAKNSMGNHWSSASRDQRTEVTSLLRKIVGHTLTKRVANAAEYSVTWRAVDEKDEKVVVSSTVTPRSVRGEETDVDYVLRRSGTGYSIVDVVIEDVSIVASHRRNFEKIINKNGITGLITKLKARAELLDDEGC